MAVRRPDPRGAREKAAAEARGADLLAWWRSRVQVDRPLSRAEWADYSELTDSPAHLAVQAMVMQLDAPAKVSESLSYYGREQYRTWYGPIPDWVEPKGDHDG